MHGFLFAVFDHQTSFEIKKFLPAGIDIHALSVLACKRLMLGGPFCGIAERESASDLIVPVAATFEDVKRLMFAFPDRMRKSLYLLFPGEAPCV